MLTSTDGAPVAPTAPEPVTVAVVNYNGRPTLAETVDSFRCATRPGDEVMVVDNASTDGSIDELVGRDPGVRVVRLSANLGPSAARNAALRESRTDLVFLSDNDIVAPPDLLDRLVAELRGRPRAAICSPRVLYSDGATVQSDGVRIHYLGAHMPRHRRMPACDVRDEAPRVHPCASGGMMLVDRARLGRDALFDEDYFFGWDDVEFSYRQSLRGFACVTVPSAAVVHREKSWGTRRSFYQVRNRWYFVLTGYAGRTLLLVAPALALYELGLALLLLAKGEGRTYLRAMGAVVRSLGTLRAKRRAIQASRVAPDAELLASGDLYIETGLVTRPWLFRLVRLANRVLDLYWRAIRGWLR